MGMRGAPLNRGRHGSPLNGGEREWAGIADLPQEGDRMAQSEECTRPRVVEEMCELVDNRHLAGPLWDMALYAPEIAARLLPGQFIHVKLPGFDNHILRRPFSVYEADAKTGILRVLYQVVGAGSAYMAELDPSFVEGVSVMGPIGNPWRLSAGVQRVLLVMGGVGAAPLAMFARELHDAGVALDVCMGAQSESLLVMKRYYEEEIGVPLACATDDGSFGHAGFVTDLASEMIAAKGYDLVCCCGPEPLMRIVAGMAREADVACEVSLERRMACGIGACLSCVVDTVDGRRRACVDGPVFDAGKVVW